LKSIICSDLRPEPPRQSGAKVFFDLQSDEKNIKTNNDCITFFVSNRLGVRARILWDRPFLPLQIGSRAGLGGFQTYLNGEEQR
jgi:hypothetical protein